MGNQARKNFTRITKSTRIVTRPAEARAGKIDPWIDPYLLWAKQTEFRDFPTMGDWYPVALGLNTTAEDFATRVREQRALRSWIQVATPYVNPPRGLEQSRFCTAFIQRHVLLDPDKLEELASATGTMVERLQLGLPRKLQMPPSGIDEKDGFDGTPDGPALALLNSIKPARRRPDPAPGIVFVGIIDDGIAFAHQRFRAKDGSTRVEYLWDQGAEALPEKPGAYGYGREFAKPDIDALINAATFAGDVDEDELYRSAGQSMVSPAGATLMRARGHGTHVLDQAAGEDPIRWTSATPGIVIVQLPDRTARDTSGASLVTNALDGIRFIIDSVEKLARERNLRKPGIVINLSYGSIAGPHDGTSLLEAAMDEIVQEYNAHPLNGHLAIVLPAGNHRHSRCHASIRIEGGKSRTLHWRILPDDATPSFMEIWLPRSLSPEALGALSVQVRSPTGLVGEPVGFGKTQEMVLRRKVDASRAMAPDAAPFEVSVYFKISFIRPSQGSAPMFLLALAPTVVHDYNPKLFADDGPTADSGTWMVEIHNGDTESVAVEAWIQRDDSLIGRPKIGRQSRFADPAYQRYDEMGRLNEIDADDAYCKRSGTINALATGQMPIVVGGFNRLLREAADYSGTGPCRPPPAGEARSGADALARSDISSLRHGLRGAGTRSGSIFWMNGTSVAAPLVTRWIAAQLGGSGSGAGPDISTARELVTTRAPRLAAGRVPPGHASQPKPKPGAIRAPMLDLPAPRHFTPDAGAEFRATAPRRRQR